MRRNTAQSGIVTLYPNTLPSRVLGTVLRVDIAVCQLVRRLCYTLNTLIFKSNRGNNNKEKHGGVNRNIYKSPNRGCRCKGVEGRCRP